MREPDLKGITLSIIITQAKKVRFESAIGELSAWRTAAGKLYHKTGPSTEKALSPNFILVYVEQSSWCRSPRGADSVPDHCCCRGVQNRSGSLGTNVCGLWTSPVPAWTWFSTSLATSATPSGQDARDRSGTSQGRDACSCVLHPLKRCNGGQRQTTQNPVAVV